MPELRQDPATREWVIIATERARRPHDFQKKAPPSPSAARDAGCPFCPDNEHMTPEQDFVIPDTGAGDGRWRVRVVPNKFAALLPQGGPERRQSGIFREMAGYGKHEVIIETPRHDQPIALMDRLQVEDIVRAYRARYRALREDTNLELILIFKNHGRAAGTSLAHPHSQLVATPVVPTTIRLRYDTATRYHDDTGQCIYCVIRDEELKRGERIVLESEEFVAVHPYASRVPFETWILPRRHDSCFGHIADESLSDFAAVLQTLLRKMYFGLGNPDFNYVVHTAPIEDEDKHYYIWHLQILPRLTVQAGFELGSGMHINVALPEETAAFMRELEA